MKLQFTCAAVVAALGAVQVRAQEAGQAPATAPVQVAPSPPAPAACPAETCIPALTPILIKIGPALSSRTSKSGDTFPLTLAEPVMLGTREVISAGTPGMGEVVHAKKTGIGVGGELVLAARYLTLGGRPIKLRSMRFVAQGKDQQHLTLAVGATVGLPALFIRGKHIDVPAGAIAEAKTAQPFLIDEPPPPVGAPPADSPPLPSQQHLSQQGTKNDQISN